MQPLNPLNKPEDSRRVLASTALRRPGLSINSPIRGKTHLYIPPRQLSPNNYSPQQQTVPTIPVYPLPSNASTAIAEDGPSLQCANPPTPVPHGGKENMDIASAAVLESSGQVETAVPLPREVMSKPLQRLVKKSSSSWRLFGLVVAFVSVVVGGAILLNAFVFQSYYVEGRSMQPVLHNNDRLIVSKVEKTAAALSGTSYVPKRGHIVIISEQGTMFSHPQDELIIKRVIGLPGDTVIIKNGSVTVVNKEHPTGFDVDQELNLKSSMTYIQKPLTVTVPEGAVFVLGDNRAEGESYDSRIFGPIKTGSVQGRLMVRILPITNVNVF